MAALKRPSRSRFAGQRLPTALLTMSSSPSTRYQMTAWRGAPSGSTVAMVRKCLAVRKSRRRSERGMGMPAMVRQEAVAGRSPSSLGGDDASAPIADDRHRDIVEDPVFAGHVERPAGALVEAPATGVLLERPQHERIEAAGAQIVHGVLQQ